MLWFAITLIAWTLVERVSGLDWQNEVNVSMCNWAQFRGQPYKFKHIIDGKERLTKKRM